MLGGFANKHNYYYWAQHNPKQTIEKCKHGLNWLCGVDSYLYKWFGPLDGMNGARYLNMEYVRPVICEWKNAGNLLFMQNGAPPHYQHDLTRHFSSRWIGRGILWASPKSRFNTMCFSCAGLGQRRSLKNQA